MNTVKQAIDIGTLLDALIGKHEARLNSEPGTSLASVDLV